MAKSNARRANSSRRNAARSRVRARDTCCWICGLPIDYSLPARDAQAYEADELIPVSLGGSPYDTANISATHRCCNNWRRARSVEYVRAVQSQLAKLKAQWFNPQQFVRAAQALELHKRDFVQFEPPTTTTDW